MSLPCCISEPIVNHMELQRENSLTSTSASSLQGCGLSHSYGLNLREREMLEKVSLIDGQVHLEGPARDL